MFKIELENDSILLDIKNLKFREEINEGVEKLNIIRF